MNNSMVGEIALAKAHALGSVALTKKRGVFLNRGELSKIKEDAARYGKVADYARIAPIEEARRARFMDYRTRDPARIKAGMVFPHEPLLAAQERSRAEANWKAFRQARRRG